MRRGTINGVLRTYLEYSSPNLINISFSSTSLTKTIMIIEKRTVPNTARNDVVQVEIAMRKKGRHLVVRGEERRTLPTLLGKPGYRFQRNHTTPHGPTEKFIGTGL